MCGWITKGIHTFMIWNFQDIYLNRVFSVICYYCSFKTPPQKKPLKTTIFPIHIRDIWVRISTSNILTILGKNEVWRTCALTKTQYKIFAPFSLHVRALSACWWRHEQNFKYGPIRTLKVIDMRLLHELYGIKYWTQNTE